MIRLNCCSHVSALEACRVDRCMVGKTVEKRRVRARGESRVAEGGRGRGGCATFPHYAGDEDRHRREAMSVTSGNYARVPVAIGLLILLGARWESVCCSRCDSPWSVADNTTWRLRMGVDFVGGVGCSGATLGSIGWQRPTANAIVDRCVHQPRQGLSSAPQDSRYVATVYDSAVLISRYTQIKEYPMTDMTHLMLPRLGLCCKMRTRN
jgi:hypothetical protein